MALRLSELDGSNCFHLDGAAPYDYSGSSVSGAGDVNGDCIDDLIVARRVQIPRWHRCRGQLWHLRRQNGRE